MKKGVASSGYEKIRLQEQSANEMIRKYVQGGVEGVFIPFDFLSPSVPFEKLDLLEEDFFLGDVIPDFADKLLEEYSFFRNAGKVIPVFAHQSPETIMTLQLGRNIMGRPNRDPHEWPSQYDNQIIHRFQVRQIPDGEREELPDDYSEGI